MDIALPVSAENNAPTASSTAYQALGGAHIVEKDAAKVRLRADSATVEVTALAPDLFRIGLFPEGRQVDYHSDAVVGQNWDVGSISIEEGAEELTIASEVATAHITLNPLRIGFTDLTGRTFAVDDPALGMGWCAPSAQSFAAHIDLPNVIGTLGTPVRVYKQHQEGEYYFGCGERTAGLNKTDSHQVFWNVDPPPGHTALQNNLYVSIPFLLTMKEGLAWGFFLDNPGRVEFDLAHEVPQRSWFEAGCGDLVYYVFCGPTPQDVLQRYTDLTGHTPLPPLWSLGNGQSRYSYETADEVRTIARSFREQDIPCDTLYLDIDCMDGYRDFTWDRTRFPDPHGLLSELADEGFHVVSIVDAGVKVDEHYSVYTDGRTRDLYCKALDGSEFQNAVWPGVSAFPDFTNPETRRWWGEQHQRLLDDGIAGIWCDMNEPSLFVPKNSTMPADVVHPGGGHTRLHCQMHNAYGSLMVQSVREGLLRLQPEKRPFVISRSGYAGVQRHALLWTGDNSSSWEHLFMSMAQLQNLGLSGVGWTGVDIGGFYGDSTGELVTRWTEIGAFQPFCRNHADKQARPQEPWVFGEPYVSACRSMLKLRQRLIPYLYSLFEECHRTGAPILRPLFWTSPEDTTTYTIDDEVMCGNALLIAPITHPGSEYRHVYLPAGSWYHFWSGERIEGPAHILAHAPLGQPAFYVRSNTAVPLGPVMNYVGEATTDPLTLLLYPTEGSGKAMLYEDAGEGYEHEQGAYARREICCDMNAGSIRIALSAREGSFVPERQHLRLELRELTVKPSCISLSGEQVNGAYDSEQRRLSIQIPESAVAQTIEIQIEQ